MYQNVVVEETNTSEEIEMGVLTASSPISTHSHQVPDPSKKGGLFTPTYIGNLMGFFINEKTGLPRVFIGPTWQFAIPVLILVCIMLYLMLSILYLLSNVAMYLRLGAVLLICLNLYFYFATLLGNPGIPQDILDLYLGDNDIETANPYSGEYSPGVC